VCFDMYEGFYTAINSYNNRLTFASLGLFVCLMVFNDTFNNISVISWWLHR
jgi:hypothetical protein